jgi:hypothetical protein
MGEAPAAPIEIARIAPEITNGDAGNILVRIIVARFISESRYPI